MTLKDAEKLVETLQIQYPPKIQDLEQFHTLTQTLLLVRRQKLAVEAECQKELTPHLERVAEIRSKYQCIKDLESVEDHLKEGIAQFVDHKLNESMVTAQMAVQAGDKTALFLANRPIPQTPGIEYRTKVDVGIEDPSKVPDKYLVKTLSPEAIKAAKRNTPIPGVSRVESTQVVISVARSEN